MSYQTQVGVAWVVFAVGLLTGTIMLVTDPGDLGLTPVAMKWVVIVNTVLTGLAGILPSIRSSGTNPNTLIDRVSALPVTQRKRVATTLANRAAAAQADDEQRAEAQTGAKG